MISASNEDENQRVLKQQVLGRAKSLSDLPEVFRGPQVTQAICDALAVGLHSAAEIFQAAYGDPGGQEYWAAYLSEPMPVYSFAYALSAHVAERADQLETARIAIIGAFHDAAEFGETWFSGDLAPLLALKRGQDNFEELAELKVHPRAAVEWLLSKPRRRYLIPESLRTFLESCEESIANKTTPARRHVTKRIAEQFAANYIRTEQTSGRRPSLVGLEAAAKDARMHGGREYLRAAFRRSLGAQVKRGRPSKA